MLINATLKIAQDMVATGNVVAEMAESLHDSTPRQSIVIPSAIAVKLLVIGDKGLA